MSRRSADRGAGGRRRYVPDWPRRVPRTRRRLGRTMLLLGALILFAVVVSARLRPTANAPTAPGETPLTLRLGGDGAWYHPDPADARLTAVTVERVIDGDTLDVRRFDGELMRVRLFGVDAPEQGQRCAAQASAALRALAGGQVRLLPDIRLQDAGGRQLRYVFRGDGLSLDAALVARGLARAWTKDGAMRDQLVALENEARSTGRGCLWADQ